MGAEIMSDPDVQRAQKRKQEEVPAAASGLPSSSSTQPAKKVKEGSGSKVVAKFKLGRRKSSAQVREFFLNVLFGLVLWFVFCVWSNGVLDRGDKCCMFLIFEEGLRVWRARAALFSNACA